MATNLEIPPQAEQVISGVLGTVANLIAPGSGAIVAKAAQAGMDIFPRIVGIFSKAKKGGASDAAAAAAAAATPPSAEEIAAAKKALQLDAEVQKYLSNITAEDRKFSTILKGDKITGGDIPAPQMMAMAIEKGQISPALLGVYSHLVSGGGSQVVGSQVVGGGSQPVGGSGDWQPVGGSQPVGGLAPGEPAKNGGWALGGFLGLFFTFTGAAFWFKIAPSIEQMYKTKRKRVLSAAKARRAKAEKAELAAKKPNQPRRIIKK